MRQEYSTLPATQSSVASGGYDYRRLPVVRSLKAYGVVARAAPDHYLIQACSDT
ncbi:MAG: hypothetical protein WBM34_00555 [Woeseiaceae bacterium]